ncbi:MAG: alpha-hydroxy-acid oxidizing protein, partial [Caulobacteraceae bacterium]|nr:alpha-hydroxy-acid oxidizing protein [Caulobacteraceae bacterium]
MKRLASVEDFRRAARRRLPGMLFHFIDGGSYAEQTLARNVADLEELALRQRVMRDTSIIDMSTELLGRRYGMPVGLCPIGMLGMLARRGEVQAGRAATAMKAPYLLSTMSVCSVEEVAKAADPPWFQLYMMKDRGYIRELLARAAAAGCSVLVLTADLSVTGARYRDVRTGFTGERGFGGSLTQVSSAALSPRWAWDVILRGGPHDLGNINDALPVGEKRTLGSLATYVAKSLDRSVTWKDLDWLREQWSGPIAVKGILDKEDARAAHAAGAQAVIVS